MEDADAAGKPFFLWFAPTVPHTPDATEAMCNYDVTTTPYGTWDPADYPTISTAYRETVCASGDTGRNQYVGASWVDVSVGALHDWLTDNGKENSTVYWWMHDHGTDKEAVTYEGAHLAMWLSFPPITQYYSSRKWLSNSYDGLVTMLDIAPTILTLARVDSVAIEELNLVGESLVVETPATSELYGYYDYDLVVDGGRTIMMEFLYGRLAMTWDPESEEYYEITETPAADGVSYECGIYDLTTDQQEATNLYDENTTHWMQKDYYTVLWVQVLDSTQPVGSSCAVNADPFYYWEVGAYSPTECPTECGSAASTMERSVICIEQNSPGVDVGDGMCHVTVGEKPVTSEACAAVECDPCDSGELVCQNNGVCSVDQCICPDFYSGTECETFTCPVLNTDAGEQSNRCGVDYNDSYCAESLSPYCNTNSGRCSDGNAAMNIGGTAYEYSEIPAECLGIDSASLNMNSGGGETDKKRCNHPCIWDAGYGDCETYATKNSAWCDNDTDLGISAKDACPQCGECATTEVCPTCSGVSCLHGGRCQEATGKCECVDGFTGDFCQNSPGYERCINPCGFYAGYGHCKTYSRELENNWNHHYCSEDENEKG
eukprot:UN22405